MNPDTETSRTTDVTASAALILDELSSALSQVLELRQDDLEAAADALSGGGRVFVLGAGRSGLALQMTAMRLMHLGLSVHVVGEVTAPAIGTDDVLLTASGSGTTTAILRAAETAAEMGARIVVLTTDGTSPLAALATNVVLVPAAGKLDRSGSVSTQYAGSLFEQTVMLIGDALFHALWLRSGQSADTLWPRHSNLE